jgi:hypothetical protein
MKTNTIGSTGSALMGAGLVLIQNDLTTGLILIATGTVMTVLVAWLQEKGLDIKANPLG